MHRIRFVGLLLCTVAIIACSSGESGAIEEVGSNRVTFVHDNDRGVGCWLIITGYGAGISCLPDNQYTP